MKTILLVEDDPFLIDIYTKQFKKTSYNIHVASDGESAVARAKELKPDLVLLDIVLPKIDGWEVLRKIREELNFKDVNIIIFSNNLQKEDVKKGEKFGAIRYISKTEYTPSEIIEEIKKILK